MAKILEMPKLSPTMEEGRLATWHKKEGDVVGIDDLLAEVETDKATMEFRAFDKGTLLKLLVEPGAMVVLGQPVAIIGNAGDDISALLGANSGSKSQSTDPPKGEPAAATKAVSAAAPPAPPAPVPATSAPAASSAPGAAPTGEPAVAPPATPVEAPAPSSDGRIKASPFVRKLAREQGFDLRGTAGSGPHGRIVARDLSAAVAARPDASAATSATTATTPTTAAIAAIASTAKTANAATTTVATAPTRTPLVARDAPLPESKPLSMMRKTIARRLTESKQTVPHFYLSVDLDVGALVALRSQINADLAATFGDKAPKISVNDLLIKAVAVSLRAVPECNAQFTPEAILYHRRIDISVAVAIEDGLVTPVVRNADRLTIRDISSTVRDLAGRAKSKKLKPEEMTGGTFSISNLGMMGIDSFAAVINPPEGAILAVGQTRREAVVRGDAIVVGERMACTLSCDHRVVDGAVGATFLQALRRFVEHPTQLLV